MLKTDTGRRENDLRAALTGLCGAVLLLCWGLWPVPARAVSISPDTLGNAMSLLSTSADCAGENLSRNRVVCRETLAGASRGQVAREVAEEVTGAGLRQMGRVSGRLGMRTLGAAATGAARAVGPAGKLAASWEFGHKLGDAVYEQAVAPRIEAHLQEKARAEQQKIREQGNLLRSDRALAQEYREILLERGPEDADAYLERRSRAARSPSTGPLDRLDENLERTERARRAAQAMEERPGNGRSGGWPLPEVGAGGAETRSRTDRPRTERAQARERRETQSERVLGDTRAEPDRQNRTGRESSTRRRDRYDENSRRTEQARQTPGLMEEDTGSYRRDSRSSPSMDAEGGETCTPTRYERMAQQCSHVNRELENWLASFLNNDSISCRALERGVEEHIRAFEACYRRVAARDPSFQDCPWASGIESWRQITANTLGSSCED